MKLGPILGPYMLKKSNATYVEVFMWIAMYLYNVYIFYKIKNKKGP